MNMEKTFYKSYKELVSDYFNLEEFKVGENAPKLSKQLSKRVLHTLRKSYKLLVSYY